MLSRSTSDKELPASMQGRYSEAEPLYKRSQAIREKALRPDHPDVASSLDGQAVLLNEQVKALPQLFMFSSLAASVFLDDLGHSPTCSAEGRQLGGAVGEFRCDAVEPCLNVLIVSAGFP